MSTMIKRGQVTLFVIIAIFIVVAVALFFSFGGLNYVYSFNNKQVEDITMNINDCLESVLIEGIYFTGMQGGYFYISNSPIQIKDYSIPVYFSKDSYNPTFPTLEMIEEQIGFYVNENILECVLTYFNSSSYNLEYNKNGQKTIVSISERGVSANLFYFVKFNQNKKTILLKEFNSFFQFDLKQKYSLILSFKEIIGTNLKYIQEGKLMGFSYNNNLTYNITYLPDNFVIYNLNFEDYDKLRKPYIFSLGAKYDW